MAYRQRCSSGDRLRSPAPGFSGALSQERGAAHRTVGQVRLLSNLSTQQLQPLPLHKFCAKQPAQAVQSLPVLVQLRGAAREAVGSHKGAECRAVHVAAALLVSRARGRAPHGHAAPAAEARRRAGRGGGHIQVQRSNASIRSRTFTFLFLQQASVH